MKKKSSVYITGHRHPDTDSIASSIAYAFFKKSMGIPTIPCRLGSLNAETSYLLDRFGFQAPQLLQDARMKLSEIDMDSPAMAAGIQSGDVIIGMDTKIRNIFII